MTDDDFRNLEHDVQRHEGDLDRQVKDIQDLREQIHTLKEEHSKETESLKENIGKLITILQYLLLRSEGIGLTRDHLIEAKRTLRELEEDLDVPNLPPIIERKP